MHYQLKSKQLIASKILELTALPIDQKLNYAAGQYVEFQLHDKRTLPFSIANAPSENGHIKFLIREDESDPLLCQFFKEVDSNQTIKLQGPFGSCVYKADNKPTVVLIAGGIGISQCKAIIEQAILNQDKRHFKLYWILKSKADLILSAEMKIWTQHLDIQMQINYGRENRDKILASLADFSQASVYIAGPWGLTDEILPQLLQYKADRNFIYSDRFEFI